MTTKAPPQEGQLAPTPVAEAAANYRVARVVAVVAGLLGALLALATPLLPVKQTTAQLNWPQNGVFSSVTALHFCRPSKVLRSASISACHIGSNA